MLLSGVSLLAIGCVGEIGPGDAGGVRASSRVGDAGVRRDDDIARRRRPIDERLCEDDLEHPFAAGMKVSQVALYQTVKIPLYADGAFPATRSAPIIEGKRALVRVFVELLDGYDPHPVQGVLRIRNGDELSEIVDERELTASSTEGELGSGFAFEIAGDQLRESTQFAVSLEEPDCEALGGDDPEARVPRSGTRALRAENTGKLHLVIVPLMVDGRMPVLTDDQLAGIRAALLAFYPIASVELGLHAPVSFNANMKNTDPSLTEELLYLTKATRAADNPPDNVYYMGVFQPTASFRVFCETVCVLGLAPQNIRIDPDEQVAVGAFFANERGYETIVHELGHAHGRGHSPCDNGIVPLGIDPNYPHSDGSVGDWGWDNRDSVLMPPTNKDIMGYCSPTWMSAYHYRAIADRSEKVNLLGAGAPQALMAGSPLTTRFRSVLLRSDGKARWGRELARAPRATEREPAKVLDAAGNVIAEVQIGRVGLSHSAGAFLTIPEPGAAWSAIVWQGQRLSLGEILPPL